MRIEIITDGSSEGTAISINGKAWKIVELSFSIRSMKKAKMQVKRLQQDGNVEFLSYYNEDFKKFDEETSLQEVKNYVGGTEGKSNSKRRD